MDPERLLQAIAEVQGCISDFTQAVEDLRTVTLEALASMSSRITRQNANITSLTVRNEAAERRISILEAKLDAMSRQGTLWVQ